MRPVNPHARLVALGCSAVVIGLSLAAFGVVSSSGDWIIASLGGIAAALGLVIVVTALIGMSRTASAPETAGRQHVSRSGEGARSFVRRARSSRKESLIAILYVVWFIYNAVAFVITLVRHQWALSLVYGALTAVMPVLVYVRGSTPKRPDASPSASD
jgi:F0F1-type ATP synthase assembly protein I